MSRGDQHGERGPRERPGARVEAWFEGLPGIEELREHQATRLLFAGVLIGVLAGVAAGALDRGIVMVSELLLGFPEPSVEEPEQWRRLAAPALSGLIAGGLVHVGTRRHRPQGIPDVLARVQTRDHILSLRDGVISATGAVLVVGGGQSGGREGPIVQLASALAAKVVRWAAIAPRHERALVAAGGAAGVAASFNTPIAGAFFALEILLGNFAMETFAPVIAATVTGTVVGQALLGDRVALHLPAFSLHSAWELPLYTALGVACGAVGAMVKRVVVLSTRLAGKGGVPEGLRGGVAGLVVGAVAWAGLPEVMGNGYAFMQQLSGHAGEYGIAFLAVLLLGKVVATAATAAGRSGAGIFAPSLFVGAVTGTLCGELFQLLFPAVVEAPGAYGMVGMAAVAGGTLHAPITMTLMLFEMTRNYAVILPLLVAVATSSVVSRVLARDSVYEAELRHQGVELSRGHEELVMHDLTVGDVMREDGFELVAAGATTGEVVARFLSRRTDTVLVVDAERRLVGVIDIQDAKRFFATSDETGHALQPRPVATLAPAQRLSDAIGAFFASPVEELPVVDVDGKLVGVLAERDVVAAYNREVLRQAVPLARVVHEGPGGVRTDFLELPPGEVLEVVPVHPWMVGRTLRELGLPARFQCAVLAIRSQNEDGSPARRRAALPETLLGAREELVVIGPAAGVRALAELGAGGADPGAEGDKTPPTPPTGP